MLPSSSLHYSKVAPTGCLLFLDINVFFILVRQVYPQLVIILGDFGSAQPTSQSCPHLEKWNEGMLHIPCWILKERQDKNIIINIIGILVLSLL